MIKRIEVSPNSPVCEGCIYFNGDIRSSTWCKAPEGTPKCVGCDTDGSLVDYIFVETSDEENTAGE
jgi:hypothetical protein